MPLKKKLEGSKRLLVAFEMAERAVPRERYPIARAGQVVGHVTSGMKSPTLGKFVGMGYVPRALRRLGAEIDILIRGKPRKAQVRRRPFYRSPG